jgi:hypothetical protein
LPGQAYGIQLDGLPETAEVDKIEKTGSSPNRMGTPFGKYILLKKRVKKVGITLSANSPARNPD